MTNEELLKSMKATLADLKKEKKYVHRYWELNQLSLAAFLSNTKITDPEFNKEWKHVNRVINKNSNWSLMHEFYMDFDKEIADAEAEIEEFKKKNRV